MFNNLIRRFYALDFVELNVGSGGSKIAVDKIGADSFEVVKQAFGSEGTATMVDAANPFPVTDAVAEAALASIAAEDFATQATLAAVLAKITNDPATQTTLAAILAKIIAAPSTEAKQDAANVLLTTIAAITQPLTDAQLRATPIPVSGTVTVDTSTLATSAKQDTGNTSLASILAKIIAAPSTEAKQDIIITALNGIDAGTAAALGQALMVASVPVVIASNQSAVPVSATNLDIRDLTFAADKVDASGSVLGAGTNNIGDVDVLSSALPTGAATSALQTQPGVDIGDVTVNNAAGASAVNIQDGGNSITVDGTVAVTGAGDATASNQVTQITAEQAIQAAVQIMDDWDESDRAKVNLIAGQAGVAGGNGLVSANTIRVVLTADQIPLSVTEASAAAILSVQGATADAIVAAGATGSVSAKLRRVTQGLEDLKTLIILAAGNAIIGKVGVDQTTDGTTNKVRATATQKPSIGATVVMTVTNLQSLASSATAGWQSARVSNLSTLATDYEIMVKLTTANTAPANDKAMYIFVSAAYTSDAGTTWFQSSGGTTTLPSGTEGTYTIASPHNLRLLGVLNYTTQQAVVQDTFLLSNCFGNRLPDGFSIIIINFSGAALSTGCVVDYSPINDILV